MPSSGNAQSALQTTKTLLFAVDLIRHGDRTPVSEIPKFHHEWKEGLGNLTETGRNQVYNLGKAMRKEYIEEFKLLPDQYAADTLYARSTDVARTIQSAKGLLTGMYPNTVVPIEVVAQEDDSLLLVRPRNGLFATAQLYLKKRNFWNRETAPLQKEISRWREATGLPLNDFDGLIVFADNLFIRQKYNILLPPGIDKESANIAIRFVEKTILQRFEWPETSEPTFRVFHATVSKYFREAARGETPLRHVLLSGHDSTLMSVLSMMGIQLNEIPPYASRLTFKLFKDNNGFSIHTTYNGISLILPTCSGIDCSLDEFTGLR